MDALPVTLGSEFAAYVTSITKARNEIIAAQKELQNVALGGTAVGTGANTPKNYRKIAISELGKIAKLSLKPERDMQHSLQSKFAVANVSSTLRNLALEIGKIANDIRLDGIRSNCRIGRAWNSSSACRIINHARKGKSIFGRMYEHDLLQHNWKRHISFLCSAGRTV